jgi:hypothetical protein
VKIGVNTMAFSRLTHEAQCCGGRRLAQVIIENTVVMIIALDLSISKSLL